jgi:hypothetical protein
VSVKIYDGRIARGTSVAVWQQKLRDAVRELRQLNVVASHNYILSMAVRLADGVACGVLPNRPGMSPLEIARQSWREDVLSLRQGLRAPWVDRSCSVSWCLDGADILVYLIAEREVQKWAEAYLGLEDFHWQNQTDKPDDVSDDEWASRESRWKGVLGDDFRLTFAEVMHEFKVAPEPELLPSLDGAKVPSEPLLSRVKWIAEEIVIRAQGQDTGHSAIINRMRAGGDLSHAYLKAVESCMKKVNAEPTLKYLSKVFK